MRAAALFTSQPSTPLLCDGGGRGGTVVMLTSDIGEDVSVSDPPARLGDMNVS